MRLNVPTILIVLLLGSTGIFPSAAHAALTLDVAHSVSDVRQGETARLEFTVSNTDGSARNDVTMSMVYPPNLLPLSEATFEGNCGSTSCTEGETVTWTIGSLPAGGSTTLHMAPVILAAAPEGTVITFDATVSDSSLDSANVTVDVTVNGSMSFDLQVSEDTDPAVPGSVINYEIDYGYRSDAASVTNSVLQFELPVGTTFVSASAGGVLAGNTIEWPLGFLSPGDSATQRVQVVADAGLTSGDVILASATLAQAGTPANAIDSTTATSIANTSGLQLAIEKNRGQARGAGTVSYVLSLTNTDPFTRFGVEMRAAFPNRLNPLSEAVFDGNCGSTSCTESERIVWTVGDVPAGATRRFEMPVTVNSAAPSGELINLDVTAFDIAGLQTRQSEVLRVNNDTRYEVLISDGSEPTLAGDELVYTVDFSYRGDAASVNNSELVVTLPPGTTFESASDGGSFSNGVVTWSLGFLSPGDSGTRSLTVISDGNLPSASILSARARIGSLTNSVQYALSEANTAVSTTSGLQISIETDNNPARPTRLMNYQLTVSNTDPFTRFGVTLTLIYPNEFAPLSEANFDGNCGSTSCTAGEIVTWTLGDIPAGKTVSVDMPSTLLSNSLTGRLVPFLVQAEDDQGVQSFKSEALRVQSDALFELALSDSRDPVVVGDELIYTLTFAYLGDSAAVVQNELQLALPEAVTFVSGSDGAMEVDGVVTWNLGFMSPGEGGTRTVKVSVDGMVPATQVLTAAGRIAVNGSPADTSVAELDTVVSLTSGLQVSMVSNPDTIRSSELSNYQVSVINRDPFTRFGVDLVGVYPQGASVLGEAEFEGDCSSTSCTASERSTWLLGDIRPGESKTVNLPARFDAAQTGGTLVDFHAKAEDDQGLQARHSATLRVQNDTVYDVAVDSSADPVEAGASLRYSITYGYREDAGAVTSTTLRFPIPTGAAFVAASSGGTLIGDAVEWNLGNLAPGEGGIVTVDVEVDAGAVNGSVIKSAATLFSNDVSFETARAEASSLVFDQAPLDLNALALTFTTEPGRELAILLSVTNNDAFTRFGVTLNARMPQGFNTLFENNGQFEGDCSSTSCVAGELIQWTIGELPAGATASVLLPPTMLSTAVEGTVIPFDAWVSDQLDAESRASVAIFTGCLNALDGDCDGVANNVDNCSLVGNTAQRDTDGDGFGNLCDPDLNNDSIVNFIDISLFAGRFLTDDADADFNGDGAVNFLDYVIMTSFFLNPPGPGADGS